MRKLFILLFLLHISIFPTSAGSATKGAGAVKLELNDGRKVISQEIGRGLMIRLVKDSSVTQKDFGWIVEVVELPHHPESKNLIYQNPTGTTADSSHVYAWQIGDPDFVNKRKLKATGYPLHVTISLKNPKTEGTAIDSRFVSGRLKVSWEWKNP